MSIVYNSTSLWSWSRQSGEVGLSRKMRAALKLWAARGPCLTKFQCTSWKRHMACWYEPNMPANRWNRARFSMSLNDPNSPLSSTACANRRILALSMTPLRQVQDVHRRPPCLVRATCRGVRTVQHGVAIIPCKGWHGSPRWACRQRCIIMKSTQPPISWFQHPAENNAIKSMALYMVY